MKKIPWAIPDIGEDEFNEVKKLFDINWLSMGPQTAKFEEAMKAYVNRKYALAVNNGTTALDIAFKVLGIKPGDEIILPAMTYIATGSMVLNQGAVPVYADIDRYTFTIMPEAIENTLLIADRCDMT
ncbi:MAG TPA: aminotransferase class I/II-fold pyridoxal phosphate-dependent enzyme, partial [bacterium]|nr:aminotransferase class I/II-fold pyridoxal phosphate-dependent enzyme [bacterium]